MADRTGISAEALRQSSLEILDRLISIDTTSRLSNMELMEFVSSKLQEHQVEARILLDNDGCKANLLATLGPAVDNGVVLSGHTDVVPVDGQNWHTDPFKLVQRDGRAYGRGTADMKAFIAVALACAPLFTTPRLLNRPVQLAFSHDEEVGCLGAPALIEALVLNGPKPAVVIVGEPSNMKVISQHKGTAAYRVTVRGAEAHSSQTHLGVSANRVAIHLMSQLAALADDLQHERLLDRAFLPDHSTLTIGTMSGGTAINILAGHCEFAFDLRCLPGADPDAVLKPFLLEVERVDADMRRRFPGTSVVARRLIQVPPLAREADSAAEQLVAKLSGDRDPPRAVSFGSEAGMFQWAGMATVICGPGSIAQAHQPNEYIEIDQVEQCVAFMIRLAGHLSHA
jgi:acetylornithine deacetylase